MEKAARELFECPVCFEIPGGEIFQCRNGHPVCDNCSKGLLQCPQCRVGLEMDKIRCRVMEAFVAGMEIGCTYEEQGCKVRLARKDLAAHLEKDCDFNSIYLCKILGLANCDFVSRQGRQDDIYRHFWEKHEANQFVTKLDDKFSGGPQDFITLGLGRSMGYMKNSKENRMTYHVADLLVGKDRLKLVIVLHTNIEQGSYSVVCLNFGGDNYPGNPLLVEVSAPGTDVSWIWKGKPINFMKAEKAMLNPPLQISIAYLLEVLGDEDEKNLRCKVSYL